jgi:hypothetical protein
MIDRFEVEREKDGRWVLKIPVSQSELETVLQTVIGAIDGKPGNGSRGRGRPRGTGSKMQQRKAQKEREDRKQVLEFLQFIQRSGGITSSEVAAKLGINPRLIGSVKAKSLAAIDRLGFSASSVLKWRKANPSDPSVTWTPKDRIGEVIEQLEKEVAGMAT